MSSTFESLGLPETITSVLSSRNYQQPTPIQEQSIPVLLEGLDLLGQAQTGTGKTAAFALPILANIDQNKNHTQVLVLTPTRELAVQVCQAFREYGSELNRIQCVPIYGGAPMSNQLRALKDGAHVVVGTPGRVMDHIRRKSLKLETLSTIILDEADEMLKMGFIEDIKWILDNAPENKQLALFSATMPSAIRAVARKHLKNATEVKIKSKTTTGDSINQRYWVARGVHKLDALTRILESEETEGVIIFVRTKQSTVDVAEALQARGHAAVAMNGDLNQNSREQVIARLKNGKTSVVVATDVAARGLDVERITHVINYDMPHDTESYVHRIGRTGRAGRTGHAILFVSPREQKMLRVIEKGTRQEIKEFELPEKEAITAKRIAHFKEQIVLTARTAKLDLFDTIASEIIAEGEVSPEQLAASLCYMAQLSKPLVATDSKKAPREEQAKRQSRGRSDRDSDRGRNRKHSRAGRDQRGGRNRGSHKEEGMETFRIAVGRDHGANPGSIVAAIAENASISGKSIGRIRLFEKHSMVDLPEGMPKSIFQNLKRAYVNNKALNISRT